MYESYGPNVLDTSGFWKMVSFQFLDPLLKRGYKKTLDFSDIEDVSHDRNIDVLCDYINSNISNGSTLRHALLKRYKKSALLAIITTVIRSTANVSIPFLITLILQFLENENRPPIFHGILFCLALFGVQFISVIMYANTYHNVTEIAADARSMSILSTFQKSLRLSPFVRQQSSSGNILTLMTVDAERIFLFFILFQWFLSCPLETVAAIVILFITVGWVAIFPVGVFFAILLATIFGSHKISLIRSKIMKITTERVRLESELLSAIRVVKLNAWEEAMFQRAQALHNKEVNLIRRYIFLSGIVSAINQMASSIISISLLSAVVWERYHNGFTLENIFDSKSGLLRSSEIFRFVALANLFKQTFTNSPVMFRSISDWRVSKARLKSFLNASEISNINNDDIDIPVLLLKPRQDHKNNGVAPRDFKRVDSRVNYLLNMVDTFKMENCTFSWADEDDSSVSPCLDHISLSIKPNQFTGLIGLTGSGKSSLIAAISGELSLPRNDNHSSNLHGSGISLYTDEKPHAAVEIVTVPQDSWVRQATVKDNIVFPEQGGSQTALQAEQSRETSDRLFLKIDHLIDYASYDLAVQISQLDADLDGWPARDMTEVGERGVTLSGGQRARVSLARGLYRVLVLLKERKARRIILLLDDPLAAVDAMVGKRIFDSLISLMKREGMNGLSLVMAMSAHYHLLRHADSIVALDKGSLLFCGSFNDALVSLEVRNVLGTSFGREIDEEDLKQSDVICQEENSLRRQSSFQALSDPSIRSIQSELIQRHLSQNQISHLSSMKIMKNDSNNSMSIEEVLQPDINHKGIILPSSDVNAEDIQTSSAINESGALIKAEKKIEGSIGFGVLGKYFELSIRDYVVRTKRNKLHILTAYSFGRPWRGIILFFCILLAYIIAMFFKWWIDMTTSFWASTSESLRSAIERENTLTPISQEDGLGSLQRTFGPYGALGMMVSSNIEDEIYRETLHWVVLLWCLAGIAMVLAILKELFLCLISSRNSKMLHKTVLVSLLRAPVPTFFDVTPIGRILNKLSKDTDQVDSLLPPTLADMIFNTTQIFFTIVACAVAVPWFLIAFIPIGSLFYFIQLFFRSSYKELKRLEALSRSPMIISLQEALTGSFVIRNMKAARTMTLSVRTHINTNNRLYVLNSFLTRWLALRLDFVSALMTLTTSILLVLLPSSSINPALAGVALTNAVQLSNVLQVTIRYVVDTEANLTAVERLLEFAPPQMPQEAVAEEDLLESSPVLEHSSEIKRYHSADQIVASGRDDSHAHYLKGEVTFRNVTMRYRSDLSPSLHNISFTVPSGKRMAIVGRSGAGKSSILQALFRLAEIDKGGDIRVSGVNTKTEMAMYDLRTQVAIIPQEPALFAWTLRKNLDPFGVFHDDILLRSLEICQLREDIERIIRANKMHAANHSVKQKEVHHLTEHFNDFPIEDDVNALEFEVADKGENLSSGQRQLVCIARAICRRCPVLVLDEATASVDTLTDMKLQSLLKGDPYEGFANMNFNLKGTNNDKFPKIIKPTVITIAHRLETIADYDIVCVIDKGTLIEFGSPKELLLKAAGPFKNLSQELGPEGFLKIQSLANQ